MRNPRRSSFFGLVLGAALAISVAGCSSLYSEAIDRGDVAAAAGNWDEAARHYQTAADLEPGEKEARDKLRNAKQHQAADRVKIAKNALAAGHPRDALRPAFDATQFDPSSADAKATFEQAHKGTLDEAQRELQAQNYRQALLVAREVLAILPADPGALDIEGQARTRIAEQAVQKGQALEKDGKLSQALLQYAEALVMRPDNGTAIGRVSDLKLQLRERVMFNVVLGTFDGDTAADNLGSNVGAQDLARGIDPRYLIRVGDKTPAKQSFTLQGMRLGGIFKGYKFQKQHSNSTRGCDYICGTELVVNPEYGRAQADLNAAQLELSNAQAAEQSAQARIPSLERAVDTAKQNESSARQARDSASSAYNSCASTAGQNASQVCASMRAVLDQAEAQFHQAENERNRAEADLSEGRSQLSQAQSRRSSAESAEFGARSRFQNTPPQIEVDKHCTHNYNVDTVSERGDVALVLNGESLYDETPTLNETVNGHFDAVDETFKAEPGFCQEIAAGDPLNLPAEGAVKKKVVEDAVSHAQGSVLNAYERYRADYLTRARAAEGDQNGDEASENYIRFLFTATAIADAENQARTKISGLVGVTPEAIDLAMKR
ncbi:MAG: hypothetical protein U0414_06765 [Polyangiaceae bacterium]